MDRYFLKKTHITDQFTNSIKKTIINCKINRLVDEQNVQINRFAFSLVGKIKDGQKTDQFTNIMIKHSLIHRDINKYIYMDRLIDR